MSKLTPEHRGLYIGKYPPPPLGERKYQLMSFRGKKGKNMRERGEKGGKCLYIGK
jgi:hypothetical protein